MREIKFRAWTTEKKRMVYLDDEYVSEAIFHSKTGGHILMQYTGLKDKNGKEIYEGDIVKAQLIEGEMPYNQEIIYRGGGFCVGGRDYVATFRAVEVIGNIYENPELL